MNKKENNGKIAVAKVVWNSLNLAGFTVMDRQANRKSPTYYKNKKIANEWFNFFDFGKFFPDKFNKDYYYGTIYLGEKQNGELKSFKESPILVFFLDNKKIYGVYGSCEVKHKEDDFFGEITFEEIANAIKNKNEYKSIFEGLQSALKDKKLHDSDKRILFNIKAKKDCSIIFDHPVENKFFSNVFRNIKFISDDEAIKILNKAISISNSENVKNVINNLIENIKKNINFSKKRKSLTLSSFLPEDYLKDLLVSVLAKPFVILAGITGTGKSLVAKEFAKAICAKHILIPVRPDWTDSSGLLGYKNVFTNQWVSTPFLEFILAADKDKDTPYVAILDEMNLARVEYYFSDFLSVLEDKERRTSGMNIEKLPMAVSYSEHSDNYWKKKWLEELKQEGKLYKKRGCSKSKRRFY